MAFWSSFFKKKYPIVVLVDEHTLTHAHIDPSVIDIMDRLRRFGYRACFVGGGVRDILLGKTPKDFDVATDARPRQIKRLFRRCFLIGRRFRLAHVYISHDRFVEVATFRALKDPEEEPDEEDRFAANNTFGSIEEDSLRRDFTVNALYFDSENSSIIDYTGGLRDLKKRVLRSIGNPVERYREDPVRIIRAARFCAQLDFRPSSDDHKAAIACAPLIATANGHRLLEELYKILRCGASASAIDNLHTFGLLFHWIPEIAGEEGFKSCIERLKIMDRKRKQDEDIPVAVLITNLFYDYFVREIGDKNGMQDRFMIMKRNFSPLISRMKIPNREWDKVSNIMARIPTFTRISDDPRWKRFEKKFVRNMYFPESLQFFEILAESSGQNKKELHYWKAITLKFPQPQREGRSAHQPHQPHQPHQQHKTHEEGTVPGKKRRGRSRPRRPRRDNPPTVNPAPED